MQQELIIGSNPDLTTAPNQRAIGDVIAMQLASITYCSLTGNIATTLQHYLPDWQLAWQPTQALGGNYAFIAFNGLQYVVAIRGSILQFSWAAFDNWIIDDFNLLEQVAWDYPANKSTKPMISKGASDGLTNLTKLQDKNGDTMLSFLMKNGISKGKFICVTGHSLGANLATVYAAWLLYQIQLAKQPVPAIFSVLTFAAPTSWNKAFADYYDAAFTNTWRYFNVIDIVPYSACTIELLGLLFPPPGTAADNIYVTYKGKTYTLPEAFIVIEGIIAASELAYGSWYTTVNQKRGSIELNTNNHIYPVTGVLDIEKWFNQAGEQHAHNHYLNWLGGTEINCQ